MKKAIEMTHQEYQSSCYRTPEYLAWHRTFKREFSNYLKSIGAQIIEIGSPNHFDISGFFQINFRWVWFRIEDLRWSKDSMLIRTAKHNKDYTGGTNCYASLESVERFEQDIQRFISRLGA